MSLAPQVPSLVEEHALAASLGDLDALAELYEHFADPLLRFLAMRTQNNVTLAEDIAGSTWEKVARSIRNYQTRGNGFEAWLFTIARRCLAEHFRWAGRRREKLHGEMLAYDQPDGSENPGELLERKFASHAIAAEVHALPAAQRKCVTLRFFVGLSLAETATVMGKSPNAIKQLQHRGLGLLRRRLRDTEFRKTTATQASVVATADYATQPQGATAGDMA